MITIKRKYTLRKEVGEIHTKCLLINETTFMISNLIKRKLKSAMSLTTSLDHGEMI